MSQHTKGPWVVNENKRERTVQIDTADGRGTIVQPGAITWLPNAPMLAAAPDMYDLLREVIAAFDGGLTLSECAKTIAAAANVVKKIDGAA